MDLKGVLKSVAPVLGTFLGGPMGGMAMKMLSNTLLGKEDASEEELMSAMASPEAWVKVKEIETNFKAQMKMAEVEERRIEASDRDSARKRHSENKDTTPAILTYILTVGFFSVIALLVFEKISDNIKDTIEVLVGVLGTAWLSCINFFFGSSSTRSIPRKD